MAKKKKQKEEVIDFTKPENISKEQLDSLQDVVNKINKAQLQMGIFTTNIHQLSHHVAGLNDELVLMQNSLEKEYGTMDIDILSGALKYPENGKVNS